MTGPTTRERRRSLTGALARASAFFCLGISAMLANPAWADPLPAVTTPPRVQKAVKRVLKVPALKGTTIGISVRSLDGQVIIDQGADRVLNPASGTKLLTTAAALHFMQPTHRFVTEVRGQLNPDTGAVEGPLVILGDGDPKLMPEHITAIAQKLKAKGVKSIEVIHVDGSAIAGDGVPPAFAQKNTTAGYRASVGGAASHFGAVWVTVIPGKVGSRASVRIDPNGGAVEVKGSVTTIAGKASNIQTTLSRLPSGRTRMVISGQVGNGIKRWKERRRLLEPNTLTGYLLRSALRRLKIKGARQAKVVLKAASSPLPPVIVSHDSLPLTAILKDVNVWSNNFMAETVFAQLSRILNPLGPAAWEDSQRAVTAVMHHHGLAPKSFKVVNGSGLYKATMISPAAMTKLLTSVMKDKRIRAKFMATLAVAGTSGTLKSRLGGSLKGRFVGKTGTLDEVVSLSGILNANSGKRYAVALILNGGKADYTGTYRAVFDRFVRALSKAL